jgi:SWI/SNF-related matrix-associated actin-dependent regulator 1 of chromatin subfamily A
MKVFLINNYVYIQPSKYLDHLRNFARNEHGKWDANLKSWVLSFSEDVVDWLKGQNVEYDKSFTSLIQNKFEEAPKPIKYTHVDLEWGTLKDSLYPFQADGVQYLADTKPYHRGLFDMPGLGKTPQSAVYLKLVEDTLPVLIVCPASLKDNWAIELEKWAGLKSVILSGRTPAWDYDTESGLRRYRVVIINYDILGHEVITKGRKDVGGWCDYLPTIGFKTIIADEVQYIGNTKALRSKSFTKICEKSKDARRIFLSGTPYTSHTAQFYNPLHLLDKETFSNKYKFLETYCDPKIGYLGYKEYKGLSNAEDLHNKVSAISIRRLKKDVLTQLPPKRKMSITMSADPVKYAEYLKLEKGMKALALSKGVKAVTKELKEAYARFRSAAYYAKRTSVFSWLHNWLESNPGEKIVLGTTHVQAFQDLMTEFGKIAVGIDGSTPTKDRQAIVEKFQGNKKIRVFVGNIKSAGVGITLTAASTLVFIELPDTATDVFQFEDRIHRISQEAENVDIYFLVCADTVESKVVKQLQKKGDQQAAVMDNVQSNGAVVGDAIEIALQEFFDLLVHEVK